MFSLFTSFFSRSLLVAGVAFIALVLQRCELKKVESDLKECQQMLADERTEKQACLSTINSQNACIDQFKANEGALAKKHKAELDNLTKQLATRKVEIVKVLQKDPSCERQLEAIEEDQKRFLDGL